MVDSWVDWVVGHDCASFSLWSAESCPGSLVAVAVVVLVLGRPVS